MQFSLILIFASLVLTGSAIPNSKRTAPSLIEEAVETISEKVDALSVIITHLYPSIQDAASPQDITAVIRTLGTGVVDLVSAIDIATADIKAVPALITESVVEEIIQVVQAKVQGAAGEPVAISQTLAVAAEGVIDMEIFNTGLRVLLQDFQGSIDEFLATLGAAVPEDFQLEVDTIRNNINAKLGPAIAAFP